MNEREAIIKYIRHMKRYALRESSSLSELAVAEIVARVYEILAQGIEAGAHLDRSIDNEVEVISGDDPRLDIYRKHKAFSEFVAYPLEEGKGDTIVRIDDAGIVTRTPANPHSDDES